jgi:hypothetical protein
MFTIIGAAAGTVRRRQATEGVRIPQRRGALAPIVATLQKAW